MSQPASQPQPEMTPAPAPTPTAAAATNSPEDTTTPAAPASQAPPSQSFTRRLDAGEDLWVWKYGLRLFLVLVAIIGTGCMGWAVSTIADGPYSYEFDDKWAILWSLITFGLSGVWCIVCILVFLLRRPNKPVHPGVAVGIDLILWLAFIPTAMFALIGALSVLNFGSDGYIGYYSSYGRYEIANNGTWVWNQTDYDSYYRNTRDCETGSYNRHSTYGFANCAEEDAYVNALWQAKPNRARVEVTGVVCQFLGLLLHLALFIWACVDTHRRNRRKVSKDAERLAGDIVMKMVRSGAIIPTQSQGGMQQPLLYPQQPQAAYGGWNHAGPAPMGQGQPMMMPQGFPQGFIPGREKGSSRFA